MDPSEKKPFGARLSGLLKTFNKRKTAPEASNLQERRRTVRRSAVCAEVTSLPEDYVPKVIMKSDEAKTRLETALAKNYIFKSLDEEQTHIVIDAVEEVKFNAGDVIIQQGDRGDHFYLLEEGTCEVWLLKPGASEPEMLKRYVAGDSFGELALLYNAPRAATIKAVDNCTLWAMDRETFRSIMLQTTRDKRTLYETFLHEVPLLKGLDKYERSAIADVLVTEYFDAGEDIIVEGEAGEKFYLLEEGEAEAKTDGVLLMKYKRGDYFGELALIKNKPRAATVTAITKCKCATIDRESFKRLFGKLDELLQTREEEYANKKVTFSDTA